jgi:tetratricopeptide (TPR) repeat protein
MNLLRSVPCRPSYSQYEGGEPVEDQAEHPPTANGALAKSSLFQMLGNTYPRPEGSQAVREESQGQDQAATQGSSMMLNQLNSMAEFLAGKGDFANAINYYEKIITVDPDNGAAWTALGHCYLLTDNLQKAFSAYQRALYYLPDVRDPQLWYGIGLLYEKVYPFLIHSSKPMSILFLL